MISDMTIITYFIFNQRVVQYHNNVGSRECMCFGNNMWIINVFYSETMTYGCPYLTSWCCKMIGDIIEPHPIALVLL